MNRFENTRKIIVYLHYRSVFVPKLNGIAFISVLMHKNSPQTHIIVTQMMFSSHHEKVDGKDEL